MVKYVFFIARKNASIFSNLNENLNSLRNIKLNFLLKNLSLKFRS